MFLLHPAKVYPERVGVGSVPYVESYVTVFVVGETEPPFGLNVTVYVFAVQQATATVLYAGYAVEVAVFETELMIET